MKTNGSMICRQRHINNAIRGRQTPWVYLLPAAPRSYWPNLALLTPLPSFLLLPWTTSFASRVMQFLVGRIVWLWEEFVQNKNVKNVSTKTIATGVSWLAALTRVSAVIVYSSSPLSDCHPHVCPFLPVSLRSFPLSFVMWKGPAGRTGAHRGTAVYLNPLMGSMGSEVLLEHWFKASLICHCNKPPLREQSDTGSLSAADIWSAVNDSSCLSRCRESKTFFKHSLRVCDYLRCGRNECSEDSVTLRLTADNSHVNKGALII